jgi:transposase
MEVLDQELARADAQFQALIADDPIVKRLTTCPSIGAITAAAFVAALGDIGRFVGPRVRPRSPAISAWFRGSTAPGSNSNEAG